MARIAGAAGVVFAGGQSRRMGRDKAFLEWHGRPLIELQIEKLAAIFEKVVISAKRREPFLSLSVGVVEDRVQDFAPIYGLRACLARLAMPVFALAVDLPEVPETLIRAITETLLAGEEDCVAVRAEGRVQGLCAAYRPRMLAEIERRVASGALSLHGLIEESQCEIWEEPLWRRHAGPGAFASLNTPGDYETLNIR